jgi:hypothetical protein
MSLHCLAVVFVYIFIFDDYDFYYINVLLLLHSTFVLCIYFSHSCLNILVYLLIGDIIIAIIVRAISCWLLAFLEMNFVF